MLSFADKKLNTIVRKVKKILIENKKILQLKNSCKPSIDSL